ncbi:uncharacterized protein EV422DRAFT_546914 [Fimicolochytrium jonesii]|uniref:uncharacterized protein n=1 Tax=Fimicolochytrium jonesii TaxID=1396493 RepID=UPI0022FDE86C|nr:uncharacterized protein EV422DRAFT_546914 [Fimicolochytrium jonesii]KAI8816138.1 hypothetical protein EV422DRAFT_546914 [Fimicolochytrium jonesii]
MPHSDAAPKALPLSGKDPLVRVSPPTFIHALSKDTSESHVTLSPLASLSGWLSLPQAWFFDYELDHDTLARALAQVLQRHPVYSGRLVDISGGLYKIELSNEGVPLARGTSHLTLADLVPRFIQGGSEVGHPAFLEFMYEPHMPTLDQILSQRKPFISASHITLADKTSVLAMRFSHALFDETHIGLFMRDWADAARGEFQMDDQTAAKDTVSNLRALANPENHIEFTGDFDAPNDTVFAFPSEEAVGGMLGTLQEALSKSAYEVFHIPQGRIDRLMTELRREDPRLSQQDCIAAVVFKIVSQCRDPGMTRMGFASDLRLKLNPPAREARACVQLSFAIPAVNAASAPLISIASSIRDAVLDKSLVAATLGIIYAGFEHGLGPRLCPTLNLVGKGPGSTQDFFCTQWSRAGLYVPDFGNGPPRKFAIIGRGGPSEPALPNVSGVWEAPPGAGGVVVGVTLYESELTLFRGKMAEFVNGKDF